VQSIALKYAIKPAHANWLEAFPFTKVAELPLDEKAPPVIPGLLSAGKTRQVYGDGSFGGPYQVEALIMDEVFQAAFEDVLNLLRFQ
jgi:creatinine amidohydrolase